MAEAAPTTIPGCQSQGGMAAKEEVVRRFTLRQPQCVRDLEFVPYLNDLDQGCGHVCPIDDEVSPVSDLGQGGAIPH